MRSRAGTRQDQLGFLSEQVVQVDDRCARPTLAGAAPCMPGVVLGVGHPAGVIQFDAIALGQLRGAVAPRLGARHRQRQLGTGRSQVGQQVQEAQRHHRAPVGSALLHLALRPYGLGGVSAAVQKRHWTQFLTDEHGLADAVSATLPPARTIHPWCP
jgi:hypothetical protein